MICPFYKNKEVFNGFNEIVEALGGRPLTEDEFKSAELRNQRSGLDFAAMEAAYTLYHRNNGNFLDLAPNGERSVLFDTYLQLFNNDRTKAIQKKAEVYSDNFINWFGDWLNDPANASKVVDENGEPLVVYHYSDNETLTEFSTDFDNYFSQSGGTKKAIFFTEDNPNEEERDSNFITKRKNKISVFLNIKDLKTYRGTKEDLHNQGTNYREVVNKSAEENDADGGVHMEDFDDNKKEHQSIWIIHNPNQVKSATDNNGMFSTENNNILRYYGESTEQQRQKPSVSKQAEQYTRKVQQVSDETIGKESAEKLNNGESANSSDIVISILSQELNDRTITPLLNVLKYNNIPVIYGETSNGNPAEIMINADGTKVIVLNKNIISGVSNRFFAEVIAHEMVHGLTQNITSNPITEDEIHLSQNLDRIFNVLTKVASRSKLDYTAIESGFYVLQNKDEFIARFLTDQNARKFVYALIRNNEKRQNVFKRFANALSRFLLNKNIFNVVTQEELSKLEKDLLDYIENRPKENIKLSDKQLEDIFNSIEQHVVDNEAAIMRSKQTSSILDEWKTFGFLGFHVVSKENTRRSHKQKPEVAKIEISKLGENIAKTLRKRKAAIDVSKKDEAFKIQHDNILNAQIDLFESGADSLIKNIDEFLFQLLPQLANDAQYILDARNNPEVEMSPTEYKYLKHDNIETYSVILKYIKNALTTNSQRHILHKQLINSGLSEEQAYALIEDVEKRVSQAITVITNAKDDLLDIEKDIMSDVVLKLGNNVNDPEILDFLNSINTDAYSEDTGAFFKSLGAPEYSKNKYVRTVASALTQVNRKAERDSFDRSKEIIRAIENLGINESVLDIYEKDVNGRTTGYVIRDLNFGQFLMDYDQFMAKLNAEFDLPASNRKAPQDQEDRIKWNEKRNTWLDERCNREYTKEYYEKYNKLSPATLTAITVINSKINQLNSIFYDENLGVYIYDTSTQERKDAYQRLQDYKISKKQLYSLNTTTGTRKTGIELQIAEELQELNRELYGNASDIVYDVETWKRLREDVITQAMSKYSTSDRNDSRVQKELREWDKLNSKEQLVPGDDSISKKAKIFQKIDEELSGYSSIVYDYNGDGGATYEANKKEISELLKPYYNPNGDGYLAKKIPDDIKRKVIKLEEENSKIKRIAKTKNPLIADTAEAIQAVWAKYIDFVETDEFKEYRKEYFQMFEEDFANSPEWYEEMFDEETGRFVGDPDFGEQDHILYRWFTKLTLKEQDKLPHGVNRSDYVEIVPGDGFILTNRTSKYKNPNYDASYGEKFVPKRDYVDENGIKRYDNSKQFNKIENSKHKNSALYTLYEETLSIIEDSHVNYGNTNFNKYLLPQELGSLYKRTKNYSWSGWTKYKIFFKVLGEYLGLSSVEDEEVYGQEVNSLLSEIDDLGNNVDYDYESGDFDEVGIRADGTPLNIIPKFKMKKLKDGSQISSDLGRILSDFYKASQKYKLRSEIQDDLELIQEYVDHKQFIKKRKYRSKVDKNSGEVKTKVEGGWLTGKNQETNTSVVIRKFLSSALYDQNQDQVVIRTPWGQQWDVSKFMSLIKRITTQMNLGFNAIVAGKAVITSFLKGIVESILGIRFNTLDFLKSFVFTLWNQGASFFVGEVGNLDTKRKQDLLMEKWNISDMRSKAIKDSHLPRAVRFIKRATNVYNMLMTADYISKKGIMTATMLGHHYYNGEFITKEDLKRLMHNKTEGERKVMYTEWKNGVRAYNVISVGKDGNLQVMDEYKDAWNKSEALLHARCLKLAERYDGMATDTQRALGMRTILISAALIHRQFLPLMLSERYGNTVYDVDTQYLENGLYRNVWNYIGSMWSDRSLTEYFKPEGDSELDYYKSFTKKKQLQRVILEVLIYFGMYSPIVTYISGLADDDKDKLLLQFMAYLTRSAEWELSTPYRISELISAIKSPSASLTTIDRTQAIVEGLANVAMNSIFPRGSLLGMFFDSETSKNTTGSDVYKRGPYKGYPKSLVTVFKLFAIHNMYEQYMDSRSKDRYFENQIMHIDKDEEYNRYKFIKSIFDSEETRTIE